MKFTADTKVFSVVQTQNDIDKLQRDLLTLGKWSQVWLMLFIVDKCKVLHLGINNMKVNYELNGVTLEEATGERGLGVVVKNDLKCSKQCLRAVSTANRVLGTTKRSFSIRDKDVILQLYKSLVKPHLEYSIHSFQKDIDLLEEVQRRATKLIFDLKYKVMKKDYVV